MLCAPVINAMAIHIPPVSTPLQQSTMAAGSKRSTRWRSLVISALLLSGIMTCTLSYHFLHKEEQRSFNEQYRSIAVAAADSLSRLSRRAQLLSRSMASVYKHSFPKRKEWLFIAYHGFVELSDVLSELSGLQQSSVGIFPVVRPHQVVDFEKFAERTFRDPTIPSISPAANDSDKLAWKIHAYRTETDAIESVIKIKFHDLEGSTSDYESPYHIATPLFQSQSPRLRKGLMFNAHSKASRGQIMDSVIACVEQKRENFAHLVSRSSFII